MYLSLLHVNVGHDPDRPRPGRLWLGNVYRVHQRLWMAFPDEMAKREEPATAPNPARCEAGFLFRIERDGRPRILVQSLQVPDWDAAFRNAPYLLESGPDRHPQVLEFDPKPCVGEAYRFRLLANVVKSTGVPHSNGATRQTRSGLTVPRRRRAEILVHPDPIPDALPSEPAERRRILLARWEPWRNWLQEVGVPRGFRVDEGLSPLFMERLNHSVRNPGRERGGSNQDEATEWRYNAGHFEGVLVCTDAKLLRESIIKGIGHGKAFGFGLLSLKRI